MNLNVMRFYETALHAHAAHYDLDEKSERDASAKDLAAFFFHAIKGMQPRVFVEAGAKDAMVSVRARRYLPEAQIVAFEANPYNFERFSRNQALAESKVVYLHQALTKESGSLTFKIKKARSGEKLKKVAGDNSILARVEDGVEYEDATVKATSLDDYFAPSLEENDFCLWVDVEGATREVLSGANKVLAKTRIMIVEVEDRPIWEGQMLRGELCRSLYERGFVPIARDFQSRYQYNIVFVKEADIDFDYFRHSLAMYHSRMGMRRRG